MVVEFITANGSWIGNFEEGSSALRIAEVHPNGVDAIVVANGIFWVVTGETRTANVLLSDTDAIIPVKEDPVGWIFSWQGLALARYCWEGLVWHTRRLSWDGIQNLSVDQSILNGEAWSPVDTCWYPFTVDINTGRSVGGSYFEKDLENWEVLNLKRQSAAG